MSNGHGLDGKGEQRVWEALDGFAMELPSWGFANTGTRFGKFLQDEAAVTLEEKFADAAAVKQAAGSVSAVALHTLWDLPNGLADVPAVRELEAEHGIRAGAINPNLFQDQRYKLGSLCNPDAATRACALEHVLVSVHIAKQLGSRDISLWLADGSSYPGTQNMRRRVDWLVEALQATHAELAPEQRLLVEYKPFEPYFYHTDIADWGMALQLCREAGPQARVLVDTGHHYQAQNVEQIVAWLLRLDMLGGFHFNDRRYADDDLTMGSIDPYAVFRIFHEVLQAGTVARDIAFMVDQSHNMKSKLQAMTQTVVVAQELFARAALVDAVALDELQTAGRLVEAEELFRAAFWTDVRPAVQAWRAARGAAADPLQALRASGYMERVAAERRTKYAGRSAGGSYA